MARGGGEMAVAKKKRTTKKVVKTSPRKRADKRSGK
jgi:hypothetical protein